MKNNLILILLLLVTNIYASVDDGKQVYLVHCASCHSISMSGGDGKDFNLVSYERTKDEIKSYTMQPNNLYKSFGYSANAMPTLPLTGNEIEDIADYIDSLQPFKKVMIK
ncbi:MAG: cytochrome c [Epsilonproteobacteria bacterium]|nr:MAG: cytochrome c [Campylobacterota bacterium]